MTEGQGMFTESIGAPSFSWGDAEIGAVVQGEILATKQQDQTVIGTNPPEPIIDPKTGKPKQQLQVILQTELRNFDGCSKQRPPSDPQGNRLDPATDDGKRAIYVKGWMVGAVGDAVKATTGKVGPPVTAGHLAVRLTERVPTQKGHPYNKYAARYQAPPPVAAGADMGWGDQGGQQQAPQQPAQQTYAQQPQQAAQPPQQPPAQQAPPTPSSPAGDPWASAPPAQQQAAPAGDPWAANPPGF